MAQLLVDGHRLAQLAQGDTRVAVPTCPGWTLRDLVEHTGFVHRWQTAVIRDAPDGFPAEESWRHGPLDGQSWSQWFLEGVDNAVDVMSQVEPREPRWSWAGPADAGWYNRRIAQETLVHRLDGELAAGLTPTPLDAAFAVDGIEEFLDVFIPASVGQSIGGNGESVRLCAADTGDGWLFTLHGDHATAVRQDHGGDAEIRGAALDLLFVVWGREPLHPVETTGDPRAVELYRAAAKL